MVLHKACEIIQFIRRMLKIIISYISYVYGILNRFMKYIFIFHISEAKETVKHVLCYRKTDNSLKNVYVPHRILIFKTGKEVLL